MCIQYSLNLRKVISKCSKNVLLHVMCHVVLIINQGTLSKLTEKDIIVNLREKKVSKISNSKQPFIYHLFIFVGKELGILIH